MDEKEFSGSQADNEFKNNAQFVDLPFYTDTDRLFVPIKNSDLIDKGLPIKDITVGFKGMAPDLGAYETGDDYWVPGVDWTPEGFAWIPGADYKKMDTP